MTKQLLISHKRLISIIALLLGLSLSTFPAKLQPLAPGEYITALDWASDGSLLVYGTGQLLPPWTEDNTDAASARVVERNGSVIFEIAYGTSIRRVDFRQTDGMLLISYLIWDYQTGQMVIRPQLDGIALDMGTWNPVNATILLSGVRESIVYDYSEDWEALSFFGDYLLPSGRFSEGERMADSVWSPDGIHVASSTTFGPIYVWDSSSLEGVLKATFTGHSASVQDAVWSPDGTLIASGDVDGNVFVWNAQTGAVVTELNGHTDAILDMDWRSDGQQIITTSLDGTMRAWTWPSGAMTIVQSGAIVSAVAYSPDGTELAYGGLVPSGSPPEVVIADAPENVPAAGRTSPPAPLQTGEGRNAR